MPLQVCMGAMMQCSFGVAPSSLVVLPTNRVMTNNVPDANIMDHIPMTNIMPFGMCTSPANPVVAAATAAALGVLTPMPCIPATPAPWITCTLGAIICGYMMVSLGAGTWARLVVWTIIGAAIYGLYGYKHSRMHRANGAAQPVSATPR